MRSEDPTSSQNDFLRGEDLRLLLVAVRGVLHASRSQRSSLLLEDDFIDMRVGQKLEILARDNRVVVRRAGVLRVAVAFSIELGVQ